MDLNFVKFFDVKSPLGILQNENELNAEYNSIGVDLYFPKFSKEFFDAIIKYDDNLIIDNNSIRNKKNDRIILTFNNGIYYIYNDIQIPTGIGILIPKDYYITNNSKSSNFKNNYYSIRGIIDENYTYGIGCQIIKNSSNPNRLEIYENEKFCQIILHKANFITNMSEIKLSDWENNIEIISRRKNRKGGFGTTGKF